MKSKNKKSQKSKKLSLKGKTILHVLTGSIAAYKSGDLVQLFRSEGARPVCVLTEGAKQFVTPVTLRALSGEMVYDDLFTRETPFDVLHTSLAEEADVVLISPASANFIARLAVGLADDLASCIVLATQKPVILVPAMNDNMYNHPLTQENLQKLKKIGYSIIDPEHGHLVCGKEAIGHIASNEAILSFVQQKLK